MKNKKTIKNILQVSVVIPNFNGEELLNKNMPSVMTAFHNPANNILEVIVVDDGSKDESALLIKNNFPEVRLIKHTKNRGFSAAVNTGVRSAKADLVALLNTDVVPREDFLEKIGIHFKDKEVFAVSLHEDGFGWAKGVFSNGFIVHEPGQEDSVLKRTFWVSGGSGVFRRDTWFELGGLDEKTFHPFYWEDVDLSYRALKRGLKLYWEPEAKVTHHHATTIGKFSKAKRNSIQERNQLLFIWKNLTSSRLLKKHVTGVFSRALRRPGYIKIIILALLRFPYVFKLRRKLAKCQKVSDEAIFQFFK
jgi:GT2 family glycosyltransferase